MQDNFGAYETGKLRDAVPDMMLIKTWCARSEKKELMWGTLKRLEMILYEVGLGVNGRYKCLPPKL